MTPRCRIFTRTASRRLILLSVSVFAAMIPRLLPAQERPRAREIGVAPGVLSPGPLNGITDVAGVLVGQVTVDDGDSVRTGITAILPHGGNLFLQRVPAAIVVGNGFGKLLGSTQVSELGELETPILLTCTLCVWKAADAMVEWMLGQPGMENVRSINPVVGETNDGFLNDIRGRHITRDDVLNAIKTAKAGPIEEGCVGAGTGTVAFGFKGGIGTSSRKLPAALGGYSVGVLVQTNFGGVLTINGAPVGQALKRYFLREELERTVGSNAPKDRADGSIIIVVGTDAPVDARNLRRIAARTMLGLGRTGASASNGSGDYAIAFSTSPDVRIRTVNGAERTMPRTVKSLPNDAISPIFQAVIEATEEAIYNSLFKATSMSARGHNVDALPLDQTLDVLRRHGLIASRP